MAEAKQRVTESEKIWDEIRSRPIEAYALPHQIVEMHVSRIDMPGDRLFVQLKSSGILPSLEATLGGSYEVEVAERYVIIKRAIDKTSAVMQAIREQEARKTAENK